MKNFYKADQIESAVYMEIVGGLANQMTCYAGARAIADRLDVPLKLDLSFYKSDFEGCTPRDFELDCLNVRYDLASPEELEVLSKARKRQIGRRRLLDDLIGTILQQKPLRCTYWNESKNNESLRYNSIVDGFSTPLSINAHFASVQYYDMDSLRNDFEFKVSNDQRKGMAKVLSDVQSSKSVSLHIRRGDYASLATARSYHGLLGIEYFQEAIAKAKELDPDVKFYVFSDDLDWVEDNLKCEDKLNMVSIDGPAYLEMYLMTQCWGNIIANSGFSRWPALLADTNDRLVIRPNRWNVADVMEDVDIAPSHWLAIDSHFES
ncbi:alpha-1,2-fucosyltransferase [Persicirhabdus sediminis]|uniref:Alpha-1,2-fucosyltransferase n=1 Tax=Persicirhabdus sediminis TaxID=454144 RepID=A0A8J7MBI4_9BACT|nr:alpha-1,2-fucosyltransferase [Persicirhabdus sediminis]MBK1790524.1 alpha-1,2-fucosyltransferase [Persicirhabdus sediminis]